MPIARYEQVVFGGTRNLEGQSLSVVNDIVRSGQISPGPSSTVLCSPITDAAIVIVNAIGTQLYAMVGASPTADPARSKWIPSGGFAIFHVPAGQTIVVATADLN